LEHLEVELLRFDRPVLLDLWGSRVLERLPVLAARRWGWRRRWNRLLHHSSVSGVLDRHLVLTKGAARVLLADVTDDRSGVSG
jgi:hypothetical protein